MVHSHGASDEEHYSDHSDYQRPCRAGELQERSVEPAELDSFHGRFIGARRGSVESLVDATGECFAKPRRQEWRTGDLVSGAYVSLEGTKTD